MGIHFTPVGQPFSEVERIINAFLRPSMSDLALLDRAVREAAAENFRKQGSAGGQWQRLAPATVKQRQRQGYGPDRPILIRSAMLWETYTSALHARHVQELTQRPAGWSFAVGSDDERAAVHEYGYRNIPARPVLLFSSTQERRIVNAVDEMLTAIEARVMSAP